MPPDVRHLFVSPVAATNNSGRLVQGPNWNETHNLQQGPAALLGRSDSTPGQAATQEVLLDPATMQFVGGKLATVGSSPAINAKDYGAIGDWNDTTQTGTDNGAAINAALLYARSIGGADVILPAASTGTSSNTTGYYTSTTVTVPERCRLIGSGGSSKSDHSVRIVGELSLSPVVNVNGNTLGLTNCSAALERIGVTRKNGIVPDTSVGVKIGDGDQLVLTDVYSWRHAFAIQVNTVGTGTKLHRVMTSICHKAHIYWTGGPELTLIDCRIGRSGGLDVACEAYVRVAPGSGMKCDTFNAIRTHFNQSGALVDCLLDFIGYADPDGIFNFIASHAEGFSLTSNVIRGDATTTVIRRMGFVASTILKSTPVNFFAMTNTACRFVDFNFGSASRTAFDMNLPAATGTQSYYILDGALLEAGLSCSGGLALTMTGCIVLGPATFSGTISEFNLSGNSFRGTFADTSTGNKSWGPNSRPSGTAINAYVPGRLGVGSTGVTTSVALRQANTMTGGVTAYGMLSDGAIQSDVTTRGSYYTTAFTVQNSTFTLSTGAHFLATQGTIGASATVTTQMGFFADASLTGGANNYGFYSNIPAGTNNYSFFGNSTAQSRFNGPVLLATFTVATLPTAVSSARARAFVSDSTVVASGNFGAVVAGTGANIVPVYSDGTNWRIG